LDVLLLIGLSEGKKITKNRIFFVKKRDYMPGTNETGCKKHAYHLTAAANSIMKGADQTAQILPLSCIFTLWAMYLIIYNFHFAYFQ
jgi:hypothetical protein